MKEENKLKIVVFIDTAFVLQIKKETNLDHHQHIEVSTLTDILKIQSMNICISWNIHSRLLFNCYSTF